MSPLPQGTSDSPSMASIEEGVPAANNNDHQVNGSSSPVVKRQGSSRLSMISKKYDVDGDGKLNEAEQAMRDMDSQDLGYLTNDKVYTIFQEQLRMQKQLLMAKRIIIFCAVLLVILAAANVGVSFAAASLAKDTNTNNNVLVVKETGEVVQTDAHHYVFDVSVDSSRRRELGSFVAGADCSPPNSLCQIQPNGQAALNVLAYCEQGLPVKLNFTSSLFSGDGTTEVLTVFHLCNIQEEQAETIIVNTQRSDGSVTDYSVNRTSAFFEVQSNIADSSQPWLFSANYVN